mgnify:CR=1 FL=1
MSVHKDESTGKWFYTFRYKDPWGKTHTKKKRGFRTKREAQREEAKDKENGCTNKLITMDELYQECRSCDLRCKDSTLSEQEAEYMISIKPYFGEMMVDKITPQLVDAWQKQQLEKYAASTVQKRKGTLSKMFTYAVKSGYIAKSPVSLSSSFKVMTQEQSFWEVETFEKFISCVDDERYNLLFTSLFATGMRIGEALSLKWSDFDGNKIHVTKTLKRVRNKTVLGDSPKTERSNRWIDLPDSLSIRLKSWKESMRNLDGFNDDFFIFGGITFLSPTTTRYRFNGYVKKSGVPRITLHGLRHSHASFLISKRIPDLMIARRRGHSINTLYKTYAHIYRSLGDELLNAIEELPC